MKVQVIDIREDGKGGYRLMRQSTEALGERATEAGAVSTREEAEAAAKTAGYVKAGSVWVKVEPA